MAALSLKEVRMVDPMKSGQVEREEMMGPSHQPWSPPWMTRPPRKKPTRMGPRRLMADEHGRVVGEEDGPCHEGEVGDGDEEGDGAFGLFYVALAIAIVVAGAGGHLFEFATEEEVVTEGGDCDGDGGFVAVVEEHFGCG
jgi:hypothetical protein